MEKVSKTKTQFECHGPFKLVTTKAKDGSKSMDKGIDAFWSSEKDKKKLEDKRKLADKKGCYIFAIRAGKGYTPLYVGLSTKGFENEIFQADKRIKYEPLAKRNRFPSATAPKQAFPTIFSWL